MRVDPIARMNSQFNFFSSKSSVQPVTKTAVNKPNTESFDEVLKRNMTEQKRNK